MNREGETETQEPIRAFDDPEGLVNVFRSEELKRAEWDRESLKKQLDLQKRIVKNIKNRDNLAAPGSEWAQGTTAGSVNREVTLIDEEIKSLRAELEELQTNGLGPR